MTRHVHVGQGQRSGRRFHAVHEGHTHLTDLGYTHLSWTHMEDGQFEAVVWGPQLPMNGSNITKGATDGN